MRGRGRGSGPDGESQASMVCIVRRVSRHPGVPRGMKVVLVLLALVSYVISNHVYRYFGIGLGRTNISIILRKRIKTQAVDENMPQRGEWMLLLLYLCYKTRNLPYNVKN